MEMMNINGSSGCLVILKVVLDIGCVRYKHVDTVTLDMTKVLLDIGCVT